MKEFPPIAKGNWFGENKTASSRLFLEKEWIKNYFKIGQWHDIPTPATTWDRRFTICPTEAKLHLVKDRDYPLAWSLCFAMNDNDYLCNSNQIWTVKAFYPGSNLYPSNPPLTTLIDEHQHVLYGDYNQGTVIIAGTEYLHACLGIAWNPSEDHAAIVIARSILWLRSCLHSKKTGGRMQHYV